jgi:putative transposase
MARCARLVSHDLPMHIMNRGNNRQLIFTNDEEKSYFLYLLHSKKRMNGIHIYHYCIMDNHLHLIVHLEPQADLSKFIKQVFLAYYSFFKNKHEYVGHLFQGRFKSIIIDTESYLIQCGKYIELNPVRAEIVSSPGDYAYSSYRFYAQGTFDPLSTPDPIYAGLGATDSARQTLYRKMVIDDKMVNSEKLRSHLYLGSEEFVNRMQERFGIRNIGLKKGRPTKPRKTETSPFY